VASSPIDSGVFAKGIENALQVKGKKNAPSELNTDEVHMIVDSLQGGFSIREKIAFTQNEAITTGTDFINISVFDSTSNIFGKNDIRFNRNHDIRILFMEMSVSGQGTAGGNNYFRLRMEDKSVPGEVVCMGVQMKAQKDVEPAVWCMPTITLESTGIMETNSVANWNGVVLAGVNLLIEYDNVVGLSNGTQILSLIGVRVPKGSQLPL